MKISLISTVLNEEKTIDPFLESILGQTKKPDEIVIVDAGSADKTVPKIKKWQKRLPIKLIIKPGVNRSQGRNIAIQNTKYQIIAVSDAGCILASNWLEKIVNPFKNKKISAVAGNYQPLTQNPFQECLAAYTCADIYKKDKRQFLPSSRSIAFRKKVWEKVGGYPKELNYCEDLVFDQKIKSAGFSFHFSPQAIVYWPQRKTIKEAFRQFYHYAFGDGQVFFSPYQSHSLKIGLIFFRYLIGLLTLVLAVKHPNLWPIPLSLLITYLCFWPIIKFKKKSLPGGAWFLTPLLQLLSDLAVMAGTLRGILEKTKKRV